MNPIPDDITFPALALAVPAFTIKLYALQGVTSRPIFTLHPAFDATVMDLRDVLPMEATVTAVRCNGSALTYRQAGNEVAVFPLLKLEAQRMELDYTCPGRTQDGPRTAPKEHPKGMAAGQVIDAPRGPDLRQGLLPAGARV